MPITPEYTELQRGQTKDRQLNGFDDITRLIGNEENKLFTLKNGYLTAKEKQMTAFNDRFAKFKEDNNLKTEDEVFENVWNKLKLGVHYDLECTSKKWGSIVTKTPDQKVTQVFCSAAAVGYSGIVNRAAWAELACGILNATYDGIFNAAKCNPTKKLFLTFVGGGVFQNSMTWICDAIYRAAVKHKNSGLKVYLNCYDGAPRSVELMLERFNKLK